ncbi:BQ2448_4263 [Microbotryum intermedium]|uniref:BQ2448_4263 protein n=1 Tax=Microbotryum intermedium TaxID=269621 RepID=A0A238FNR3_9BASI|nr:BQ2448_4263 [Microbotryum intermedium]
MTDTTEFTFEDLKARSSKKDLHMLIHGKVYAIAKFLDEHPGGDEVLLGEAGKDATEAFEDVGHSDEARAILDKYFVGNGPASSSKEAPKRATRTTGGLGDQPQSYAYLYPLAGVVAYAAYRIYENYIAK